MAAWTATERFRGWQSAPPASEALMAGLADLDEAQLVDQARRGETRAYDRLVARYQEVAFRTAYLVARDPADAEDAAQQGFIKAYRALGRFRPGAPFRPWLLRIVANEARNARRAAGSRARLALRLGPRGDTVASPEEEVLGRERRQQLLDALERVGEDDRLVIAYRYFVGLSEAEMATALDCPPGTVKSRLSRALRRLRQDLVEGEPPAPRAEVGR